jgi:acetolactate synthase small subunit
MRSKRNFLESSVSQSSELQNERTDMEIVAEYDDIVEAMESQFERVFSEITAAVQLDEMVYRQLAIAAVRVAVERFGELCHPRKGGTKVIDATTRVELNDILTESLRKWEGLTANAFVQSNTRSYATGRAELIKRIMEKI